MRVALKLCSEKESASGARSEFRLRGRKQAVALRLLACDLARPPNGFRPFADLSLRRLLIGSALPQFAKDAFALHLLLEDSHRLIDIVIAHHDQQYNLPSVDCQIKRLCQSLPPVAIPRKPRGERSDGSAPQAASARYIRGRRPRFGAGGFRRPGAGLRTSCPDRGSCISSKLIFWPS